MSRPKQQPDTARPSKVRKPHRIDGGTPEASRTAVVILEVLAGVRTPLDAAAALAVSPPRYYQLETRALNGLVVALEPRPKGKQPSLEGRITQLERELQEARREGMRQQALVRAAQRSLGIKAPQVPDDKHPEKDRVGRRKRRPVVRALRAARTLANQARSAEAEVLQQQQLSVPPREMAVAANGASGGTPSIEQGGSQ
jgi:hypothetical protein